MTGILIVVFVVFLTFIAPWWIKIILTGLNMFLLPDAIPFVDEILQCFNTFNSLTSVKAVKYASSARKIKRFIE